MSYDEDFNTALSTFIAGTTSSGVDTATTESAAETIRSRIGDVATSAGQTIAQLYRDIMFNPSNPIMSTVMSAAAESNPFSEVTAISFYTYQALYHIVAPSVPTKAQRDAMVADLKAKEAELSATIALLAQVRSRNSHFSWEQGTRD